MPRLPHVSTPALVRVFFVLLCGVFAALGFNTLYYPFMYAATAVGLWLLCRAWPHQDSATRLRWLLPLPFILCVALSPGWWLKDLSVADKMLSACIMGLAAGIWLEKRLFLAFLCLPLSLTALLLFVLFTGQPAMLQDGRLCLLYVHSNHLGFVSLLSLLILPECRAPLQDRFGRAAVWALLPMACALLAMGILSASRSSLLGFAAAALVWAFFRYRPRLVRAVSVLKGVCLVVALTLGMALFARATLPEAQWQRLCAMVTSPMQDATFQSRLPLWDIALKGLAEAPLFGQSIRGYPAYFNDALKHDGDALKQRYPHIEAQANHPHNLYLGFGFAYGAVGFGLFLLALAPLFLPPSPSVSFSPSSSLSPSVCLHDEGATYRHARTLFLVILCFYLAHGLFDYTLHRKDGILFFFFFLSAVRARG